MGFRDEVEVDMEKVQCIVLIHFDAVTSLLGERLNSKRRTSLLSPQGTLEVIYIESHFLTMVFKRLDSVI